MYFLEQSATEYIFLLYLSEQDKRERLASKTKNTKTPLYIHNSDTNLN